MEAARELTIGEGDLQDLKVFLNIANQERQDHFSFFLWEVKDDVSVLYHNAKGYNLKFKMEHEGIGRDLDFCIKSSTLNSILVLSDVVSLKFKDRQIEILCNGNERFIIPTVDSTELPSIERIDVSSENRIDSDNDRWIDHERVNKINGKLIGISDDFNRSLTLVIRQGELSVFSTSRDKLALVKFDADWSGNDVSFSLSLKQFNTLYRLIKTKPISGLYQRENRIFFDFKNLTLMFTNIINSGSELTNLKGIFEESSDCIFSVSRKYINAAISKVSLMLSRSDDIIKMHFGTSKLKLEGYSPVNGSVEIKIPINNRFGNVLNLEINIDVLRNLLKRNSSDELLITYLRDKNALKIEFEDSHYLISVR